jgi:hypothetical protein
MYNVSLVMLKSSGTYENLNWLLILTIRGIFYANTRQMTPACKMELLNLIKSRNYILLEIYNNLKNGKALVITSSYVIC